MAASAVEFYKKAGVDGEDFMLMPQTEKAEGEYYASGLIDMMLGLLISLYHKKEQQGKLEIVPHAPSNEAHWARIADLSAFENEEKEGREVIEYSILMCCLKGYIAIHFYDEVRYFHLTEKALDDKLYK